jgi:hypothetical protein
MVCVTPSLMFDGNASEAIALYLEAFPAAGMCGLRFGMCLSLRLRLYEELICPIRKHVYFRLRKE